MKKPYILIEESPLFLIRKKDIDDNIILLKVNEQMVLKKSKSCIGVFYGEVAIEGASVCWRYIDS